MIPTLGLFVMLVSQISSPAATQPDPHPALIAADPILSLAGRDGNLYPDVWRLIEGAGDINGD